MFNTNSYTLKNLSILFCSATGSNTAASLEVFCPQTCTHRYRNRVVAEAWAQVPMATPPLFRSTRSTSGWCCCKLLQGFFWKIVNFQSLIFDIIWCTPVRKLCSLICLEHLLAISSVAYTHQSSSSSTHWKSGPETWSLSEDENPGTWFILDIEPCCLSSFIVFLHHKLVAFSKGSTQLRYLLTGPNLSVWNQHTSTRIKTLWPPYSWSQKTKTGQTFSG